MVDKKFYEARYTPEQQKLAEEIIGMEKVALDKFFKGDMSGYLDLWSKDNFTYFDAGTEERADTYEEVAHFLKTVVEGNMHADSYDFHAPRVQFGEDIAILTFQLHADTSMIEMHYNVIEIFQKDASGWHVIHSTWALITPFSPNVKKPKVVV
ncbi:nuclear transport factor 2 family protein [Clostridium estertheticum]|uniref:nuclear transport factor 2 family protein n=1 Tax=Clostridium estertheticum TaxID=238834 RepID=UPI001CF4682C|nr:nuclear transport factor 2 family protein [Clostridium estertheticum]MCB2360906.1 nuclear transport factor 2 family protein [Clostridium estertheticum]